MKKIFTLISLTLLLFVFIPIYERDVVLYQLSIPKIWLENSLFSPFFSHFFFYPYLPFLFNFLALYFKMPFLSSFFHFIFAFFTVFLIYISVKNKNTAVFIASIFITLQPFLRFSYVAYSDFYLTFFSLGALLLVKSSYERKDFLSFLLSAILCGMGLNTKYNMLVFSLLLYIFVFWLSYQYFEDVKKAFKDTFLYFIISFTLFVPFLLKNFLLTGSPLYPFLTGIFPVKNSFAFENVSHFAFRKYFFAENLLQILLTPIMVFFYGVENNIQYFDGVLNPFFVIMPIIAVFAMKDKMITVLFLFGWLYNYFVLFLEPVSARFLLPSIPVFAYVSGQYLSSLKLSDKKLLLIFLPFLIFNLYFSGKHIIDKDKWQYLSGKVSKDEFLERKCPDYKSIKFINENTPKNSKIFYLFSGQRTYYLERDFIYDSFNDGRIFKKLFDGSKGDKEFLQRLREQDITHLFIRKDLFEKFLADNFSDEEIIILNKFFVTYAKLLFQDGVFLVVELKFDRS